MVINNSDFIHLSKVRFTEKECIQTEEAGPYRYKVKLPHWLASLDIYEYWERARFLSMEENLKKGDILFDIGTEKGWQSVIYAGFVGAENMILIEPEPLVWPNIKGIWEENGLADPMATYWGLFGNIQDDGTLNESYRGVWPEVAFSEFMFMPTSYRYLHEARHVTPHTTVDAFVEKTGIVPTALTMDTEGAEIRVLQGAVETMKKHHPMVWASLHPDSALKYQNSPVQEVHDLMQLLGYTANDLGTDHEEHFFYAWRHQHSD